MSTTWHPIGGRRRASLTDERGSLAISGGRSFVALVALLALSIVAGGCAAPAERVEPTPAIRFVEDPPIALDVDRVEHATPVSGDTATSANDAFAEVIGVRPEAVVRQWADDRLMASGSDGVARVTAVTAAVTEDRLPRAKGAVGLFGSAPGASYTMTVEGRVEIMAADGGQAMASARVARTKSLEGNRTRAERQRFWIDLVTTTMAEFDHQMEQAIRRHLNPWVL